MSLANSSGMITIVIADDEPAIVELIRLTLEDDRVRVFEAYDGQGALALASMLHPDLIFLDVHLPDLTGLDVCRALREDEKFRATRIVMLTAAARAEDVARGLAAGADHYLTKPFSPLRLLSLVETLVPRAISWQPDRA
jgi:two-component system phosphate regulon response regulator PhoB